MNTEDETKNPMPEYSAKDLLKWCVNEPEEVEIFLEWVKDRVVETSQEIVRKNDWDCEAYFACFHETPFPTPFKHWMNEEWRLWANNNLDKAKWGKHAETVAEHAERLGLALGG